MTRKFITYSFLFWRLSTRTLPTLIVCKNACKNCWGLYTRIGIIPSNISDIYWKLALTRWESDIHNIRKKSFAVLRMTLKVETFWFSTGVQRCNDNFDLWSNHNIVKPNCQAVLSFVEIFSKIQNFHRTVVHSLNAGKKLDGLDLTSCRLGS